MLVSTIMPLRVEYSFDAPGEAPTRLLLKSSRDGLGAGLQAIVGEREVIDLFDDPAIIVDHNYWRDAAWHKAVRRDDFAAE